MQHFESWIAQSRAARWIAWLGLHCLVLGIAPVFAQGSLATYRIDPAKVTVSGISSGGYMAVQLGVAYSTIFSGVGVVAAGPYGCADTGGSSFANATRAVGPCMAGSYALLQRWQCAVGLAHCPGRNAPDADASVALVKEKEAQHRIDPLSGLARQRVFVLSGDRDDTVVPSVVEALAGFYAKLVPTVNVAQVRRPGMGHTFPTTDFGQGNACATTGAPFISDCNYDGAEHLLAHLYGALQPHGNAPAAAEIIELDQRPYFPANINPGMADKGYLYVPPACAEAAQVACGLHVALHGCKQGASEIGTAFVLHAGYNRWAETNRLLVLYPQVKKSEGAASENPEGCWDWWGYSGTGWDDKRSLQMRTIVAMVNRLKAP